MNHYKNGLPSEKGDFFQGGGGLGRGVPPKNNWKKKLGATSFPGFSPTHPYIPLSLCRSIGTNWREHWE